MVGMVLGNRYELIEKIGTGGMAEVYKAKCRLLNRFVAVKILKQEYINDEEFLARFKTESQAAASLSHHNIVSIYDVGRDGDCNYIVMEYIEGITLKEYIEKNGVFSWREAIEISVRILDALEHAHKHNIVHRDIKPHNIMVTPDKDIKVMDFGIARAATASTLTLSGTTIGSVHYFSPEQAKGSYTDSKSDIYSMGVVMYEMLTGRVPFDGDSPISIAIMQIQNNPPSLKDYNLSVPLALESVIMKAMSKDRDMRYQTAAAMANDLLLIDKLPGVAVKIEDEEKPEEVAGTRVIPSVKDRDIEDYVARNRDNSPKQPVKKEEVQTLNKGKKKDKGTIAAIVAAGVLILSVVIFMMLLLGGNPEAKVPNLVGMTFDEACEKYESDLITIIKAGEEASEKYADGIIISQDPKKGAGYKSKTTISVIISGGSDYIVLDDYSNLSIEEAIEKISTTGLDYEQLSVEDDEVEPGKVIKTKPKAKTKVRKDQIIIFYVSSIEDTVIVPNLMGKTLEKAKELIEEAGLKLGEVSYMPSTREAGTVLQQVASAGETVDKDASIDLIVAKESKEVSKTITVTIPQNSDSTNIKVVANGKTFFNASVNKTEIAKDVVVEGSSPLTVEIYHNGVLVSSNKYE
ncbi:MAG: Stk1 family PASTA domain-containing Ser/Thr kinase [Eubacteriales bacterium]|nr:Stk1 family PASTA domain-containing Ser/Thr kinase [Eubacteriales bacterium]